VTTPEDSHELGDARYSARYLNPGDIRLFRAPKGDSRLRAEVDGKSSVVDVRIARLLPLTDPDHLIALRDGDDKEVGILRDLNVLDDESARLAREELTERYFLPIVQRVYSVKDQFGVISWDVETDHGRKRFAVRNLADNSIVLSPVRVIMSDVGGSRYEFSNITTLGAAAFDVLTKVL
jgi:hypothetical protein